MARRLTGVRNGYRRFALDSLDDVDLAAVVRLMDGAWRADYRDRVRMAFDEAFLRRLAVPHEWVGVLVSDPAGAPVGFEMACARTLRAGERSRRTFYTTVFTVSERHRRRGLGRWILEGINDLVFGEGRGDCIFSTFHEGQSGSPTVQSTFDAIEGFAVRRLHTSPIHARRLGKGPPLPEQGVGAVEVVLDPTRGELVVEEGGARLAGAPVLAELEAAIGARCSAAFRHDASFPGHYLRGGSDRGALWYESPPCLVTWWISPLRANEQTLPPMGQVQTIFCLDPQASLAPVLADVGRRFTSRGCLAMSLLDTGSVPPGDLDALGFEAAADRITFAVRGPREIVDELANAEPPFYFDFV